MRKDWDNIARRMCAIPAALESYQESLAEGARAGHIAALRQVEAVIKQADDLADFDNSMFTDLANGAALTDADGERRDLPAALRRKLDDGAKDARQAYADLAVYLSETLAHTAPTTDAVGEQRYARFSRAFLGAEVDLEETYEWGLAELDRVIAEQRELKNPESEEMIDRALDTIQMTASNARDMIKPAKPLDGEIIG